MKIVSLLPCLKEPQQQQKDLTINSEDEQKINEPKIKIKIKTPSDKISIP